MCRIWRMSISGKVDTLVVMADDSFVQTWGESSVFVMLANGKDTEPVASKGKRWFALALLILMITGATVGELPAVKEVFSGYQTGYVLFRVRYNHSNGMDKNLSGP